MREQIPSFVLTISLSVLTPVPSAHYIGSIAVWDIKTGVIVKEIITDVEGLDRLVFSGYYTVTLVTRGVFSTYDALDGTLLCEGEILPRFCRQLGAHWEYGDSLQFATSYTADGKSAIDIHQLQPSSIPPFSMVESFIVPPHDGEFSFSPVSFHASFVTWVEITVLDVRDSKILLQVEPPEVFYSGYTGSGCFSSDGGFFACGIQDEEIHIWKNMPAGYMPWSCLKPRLPFRSFSFLPTAISILA